MVWVRILDPHPKTHGKWNKQTLKPNYNLFLAKFQWFFSQQKLWVLFWGEGGNPEVLRERCWWNLGGNFSPLPRLGEEKVKILEGQKIKLTFGATYHGHPQVLFRFAQPAPITNSVGHPPKNSTLRQSNFRPPWAIYNIFCVTSHAILKNQHLPNRFASDGKDQVSTRSIGLKELLLGSRNLHTKSIQDRCPARHPRKGPFFWGEGNHLFSKTHAPERRGKGDGRARASGILVGFR